MSKYLVSVKDNDVSKATICQEFFYNFSRACHEENDNYLEELKRLKKEVESYIESEKWRIEKGL